MLFKSTVVENVPWSVDIDLKENWNSILAVLLSKAGYKISDTSHASVDYFNVLKRSIVPMPRKVEISGGFSCPLGYENALDEIKSRITKGESIHPFLSKQYRNADFNDMLFNDWGIMHLHLSNHFNTGGYAERSDYQVFVRFKDDIAYFIQIYPHKENAVYAKEDLIQIIYHNWPESIEKEYIILGATVSKSISDSERQLARKCGISTLYQLDKNKLLFSPGGGYMSNGKSMRAIEASDYWLKKLSTCQITVLDNMAAFLKGIEELTGKTPDHNLRIVLLWISEDVTCLYEQKNNAIIQIPHNLISVRICYPYQLFEDFSRPSSLERLVQKVVVTNLSRRRTY